MSQQAGTTRSRTIHVSALARVEGEGALRVEMDGREVKAVQLQIYEPPRFYEAFLRGRSYAEVPDITARICGICPVAYQMSSCHALERAFGVFDAVDSAIRDLRTYLYCGEWIESHVLHIFMLHLPDFLGYESAISMAADHGDIVRRALRLKKLGNAIVASLGGRAVHPVGACVGGFHAPLSQARAGELLKEVRLGLEDMCELTLFLAENIEFPDLERDYEFVALSAGDEYAVNLGRIRSNKGLDIDQEEFGHVIEERHMPHSTALHSVLRDRGPYMVGPLARLNLNAAQLHPRAQELLPKLCDRVGSSLPWRNNFWSLLARSLEVVHALAWTADFLGGYRPPERSRIALVPRAGTGAHGTEAPRGICWHQYRTDAEGIVERARIVPPTSQNQATIEADLRLLAERLTEVPDEDAALQCEHLIRNYDPCISCSVHFLDFRRTWAPEPRT